MARICNDLARHVYICVDERVNREPVGRIYSPVEGQSGFGGVLPLISQVETLLDHNDGPQASHETRTFGKRSKNMRTWANQPSGSENPESERKSSPMAEEMEKQTIQLEAENGRQATFIINVKYRQNATWQGKIQWIEEKKEQTFRSTLEMIKLMDEALSAQEEQKTADGWQYE